MLKEFRTFLIRGNVIDLAVGVIAGIVFGAVITSAVNDIIMQVVAAIFGKPDFSSLVLTINNSEIRYGAFLNAIISFVLTMAGVFFLIVKPVAAITAKLRSPEGDGVSTQRECPECLSEIPAAASRCRACTAQVSPVA